jgi:hypothetical protein
MLLLHVKLPPSDLRTLTEDVRLCIDKSKLVESLNYGNRWALHPMVKSRRIHHCLLVDKQYCSPMRLNC